MMKQPIDLDEQRRRREETRRQLALVDLVALVRRDCYDLQRTGKRTHKCRCPFHSERTASFTIYDDGPDGYNYYCYSCEAKGDAANYLQETRQWSYPEALRYLGISEGPQPDYQPLPARPEPHAKAASDTGTLAATYNYSDETNKLRYQVQKYILADSAKTFRQRRPDGADGWIYNLKDVEPLIYRLPELLAADPAAPVFIVEGEKDADRLIGMGLAATCNSGGAGRWPDAQSQHLQGRHVVIVPDNDQSGERHAVDVAASVAPFAASVKIVRLPHLPAKGDVSDYLDRTGFGAHALLALADFADEYIPGLLADEGGADDVEWATKYALLCQRLDTIDTLMRDNSRQTNDRVLLYNYQRFCEEHDLEPGKEMLVRAADFGASCGISESQAEKWLDMLAQNWYAEDSGAVVTSWRQIGSFARHMRQDVLQLDAKGHPKINRNTGKPIVKNMGSVVTCQSRPFDLMATIKIVSPKIAENRRQGGARLSPSGNEMQVTDYSPVDRTIYDRTTGTLLALTVPVMRGQDGKTLHADPKSVTFEQDAALILRISGRVLPDRDIRRRGLHDSPHTTGRAYIPAGISPLIDPEHINKPVPGRQMYPTVGRALEAEQRTNLTYSEPRGKLRHIGNPVTPEQDAPKGQETQLRRSQREIADGVFNEVEVSA